MENELGPRGWAGLSEDNQILVLKQLMSCDLTAQFLNEKFPAAKVYNTEETISAYYPTYSNYIGIQYSLSMYIYAGIWYRRM